MNRKSLLGILLAVSTLLALRPAYATPTTSAAHESGAAKPEIRRWFDPKQKKELPPHWTIAGNTYVSPNEYQDLANGVKELLKRYPPNKYFFVGLGRDPAPVIAFLQNLGEKHLAVNLPGTSNIQWNGQVGPEDVARHIEAAVPAHILKGDRDIVILDVTSSGKTPAVFGPYFDQYLKDRGIKKKVVRLAFSWQNVMTGGYGNQLTDWIDTAQWADFSNYFTGKYEGQWAPGTGGTGIAEHQRHSMAREAQPPTQTSPNYAAFREALKARMQQDAELDQFLIKEVIKDPEAVKRAAEEARKAAAEREAEEKRAAAEREAEERKTAAERLAVMKAFPKLMKESAEKVVSGLPKRSLEKDPHSKGPYLSESGEKLRGWFDQALQRQEEAAEKVSEIKESGPNLVTEHFIVHTLEDARASNKIRKRDYRRLLGYAIASSTMDDEMVKVLSSHYRKSKEMRREFDEEAEEFVSEKTRELAGHEKLAKNFRTLMGTIDPKRKIE